MDHGRSTRNNQHCIILPKTRLSGTQKAFFYQAGIIFNNLPLHIRKIDNTMDFLKAIKLYFK